MLGNTITASNKGITCSAKTNKTTGYKMKTIDNSLFVVGATPRGTLFGIYDLLHEMINYRCYASDELYYDTNVSKLELPDFDISFPSTPGSFAEVTTDETVETPSCLSQEHKDNVIISHKIIIHILFIFYIISIII